MSVPHKLFQSWHSLLVFGAALAVSACTTATFGPTPPTGDVSVAPAEATIAETTIEEVAAEEMEAEAEVAEAEAAEAEVAPAPAEAAADPESSTDAAVETSANAGSNSEVEPAALTIEQMRILQSLESSGPPPELTNEVWLNSEPLQLADLRGQVVIVEFWTYGCINCQNVLPDLKAWHEKYADEGLTIIGVHTPEFTFEKDLNNVQQALVNYGINYPVAIDNDKVTWRAYNNRYWPAMYFIDKAGNVRHLKIGEGRMAEAEKVLQALLAEPL